MDPKVKVLIEREYAAQKSQEWLNLRNTMLTASDVATVLGQNPYEGPDSLLLKKCGLKKFSGNTATFHGEEYEDIAREMYDKERGQKTHEIGLCPHPIHTWLGGSPDGVTESGRLVEIKCPLSRKIDKDGKIPHHYMAQVQLLMHILDLPVCDFVQYKPLKVSFPKPEQFTIYEVPRDPEWLDKHIGTLRTFWDKVLWHRANPGHLQAPKSETKTKEKKSKKVVCEL